MCETDDLKKLEDNIRSEEQNVKTAITPTAREKAQKKASRIRQVIDNISEEKAQSQED